MNAFFCPLTIIYRSSKRTGRAGNKVLHAGQTFMLCVLTFVWETSRVGLFGRLIFEMFSMPGRPERWTEMPPIWNGLRVLLVMMLMLQAVWGLYCVRLTVMQLVYGSFDDVVSGDLRFLTLHL